MPIKRNLKVEKMLEIIENDPKVVFIGDLCNSIPCAESTFRGYFPLESEDFKKIEEALEANKCKMKREVRDRLADSNSPASLIFLYKILTKDLKERAQLDGKIIIEEKKSDDKTEIELTIE